MASNSHQIYTKGKDTEKIENSSTHPKENTKKI